MIPLRAESSTVSLPPRERTLAKRRAKAIKLGLSPSVACKSPAKRARKRAKAPVPPTLAATCQRRAAANVAYIEQPDGYHVKQVVRRVTPGPAPPVPYLPGEEDLPHSDAESDGSDATELQLVSSNNLGELSTTFDVGLEADETPTEPDIDLVDYDAEGEDEDEDIHMQDLPPVNYSFTPAPAHIGVFGSTTSTEAASSTQLTNPFADASNDDIQALFGGLNNLHFGDSPATNDGDLPGFADAHSRPIPDRWAAHAQYLFGSISDEPQYDVQGSKEWEPFTMDRLNATVNDLQARPSGLAPIDHSTGLPSDHSMPLPLVNNSPRPHHPLTRVATPAPWIVVPDIQASIPPQPATPLTQSRSAPLPPAHDATRYMLASHTGAPIGSPFSLRAPTSPHPHPHLSTRSTRELVSQARAQARAPHSHVHPPPTYPTNADNPHTRSLLDHDHNNSHPFRITPLRLSLHLPDFLDNAGDNTDNAISEGEEQRLDPDTSQPSTPVALEDTDIGLNEHSPYSNPAPETLRRNRSVLRSGALTPDQQSVASPMEYSILKDIICDNPWPEDRDAFLRAAQEYTTNVTGISGADVYTHRFLDTIFYRTSGNRGNSLSKIEVMMEQEFTITTVNKPELYQLMNKDQFLYPTADWDPSQYFCVGALGAALEIILFKSAKTVGLVFMEEFCQPDDAEKCAHWHRKLHDRTAHKGVSPGAIAFAATQYWALEKLYLGTNIHFEEGHFRGIWERYVRALIKLPHLGQLRIDLLDRLKEYYMDHWPSDERDEDDNSFLAW